MLVLSLIGGAEAYGFDDIADASEPFAATGRWVCWATIGRGTVTGRGSTMEQAWDSVLGRSFPNRACLARMRCVER